MLGMHIWYAGSFREYPTSEGHIKVKVEYQGYISQKMAVSGALVFHKHILFFFIFTVVLGDLCRAAVVQIGIVRPHCRNKHHYFHAVS